LRARSHTPKGWGAGFGGGSTNAGAFCHPYPRIFDAKKVLVIKTNLSFSSRGVEPTKTNPMASYDDGTLYDSGAR